MKVEILTLCDAATVDQNGKLNILGCFDHVWARCPFKYPICSLAAKLRFEKSEEGQKRLTFAFIDADGRSVMPVLNVPINVQVFPSESSAIVPFAMIIQQLNLPRYGEYSIGLSVDGRQEASIPLFVREAPIIPPFHQPPA